MPEELSIEELRRRRERRLAQYIPVGAEARRRLSEAATARSAGRITEEAYVQELERIQGIEAAPKKFIAQVDAEAEQLNVYLESVSEEIQSLEANRQQLIKTDAALSDNIVTIRNGMSQVKEDNERRKKELQAVFDKRMRELSSMIKWYPDVKEKYSPEQESLREEFQRELLNIDTEYNDNMRALQIADQENYEKIIQTDNALDDVQKNIAGWQSHKRLLDAQRMSLNSAPRNAVNSECPRCGLQTDIPPGFACPSCEARLGSVYQEPEQPQLMERPPVMTASGPKYTMREEPGSVTEEKLVRTMQRTAPAGTYRVTERKGEPTLEKKVGWFTKPAPPAPRPVTIREGLPMSFLGIPKEDTSESLEEALPLSFMPIEQTGGAEEGVPMGLLPLAGERGEAEEGGLPLSFLPFKEGSQPLEEALPIGLLPMEETPVLKVKKRELTVPIENLPGWFHGCSFSSLPAILKYGLQPGSFTFAADSLGREAVTGRAVYLTADPNEASDYARGGPVLEIERAPDDVYFIRYAPGMSRGGQYQVISAAPIPPGMIKRIFLSEETMDEWSLIPELERFRSIVVVLSREDVLSNVVAQLYGLPVKQLVSETNVLLNTRYRKAVQRFERAFETLYCPVCGEHGIYERLEQHIASVHPDLFLQRPREVKTLSRTIMPSVTPVSLFEGKNSCPNGAHEFYVGEDGYNICARCGTKASRAPGGGLVRVEAALAAVKQELDVDNIKYTTEFENQFNILEQRTMVEHKIIPAAIKGKVQNRNLYLEKIFEASNVEGIAAAERAGLTSTVEFTFKPESNVRNESMENINKVER